MALIVVLEARDSGGFMDAQAPSGKRGQLLCVVSSFIEWCHVSDVRLAETHYVAHLHTISPDCCVFYCYSLLDLTQLSWFLCCLGRQTRTFMQIRNSRM